MSSTPHAARLVHPAGRSNPDSFVMSVVGPLTPLPLDSFVGTINDTPAGLISAPRDPATCPVPPAEGSVTPRIQGATVPAEGTAEWKVVHATIMGPSLTPSAGRSCALVFFLAPIGVGEVVALGEEVFTVEMRWIPVSSQRALEGEWVGPRGGERVVPVGVEVNLLVEFVF